MKHQQGQNCSLGSQDFLAIEYHQRSWLPELDEDWTPRVLDPIAKHRCTRCQVSVHKTRNQIARMLKVSWHNGTQHVSLTCSKERLGTLSFTTDVWSSPNHKAYIAVTVHFKQDSVPVSMLLNIVEVPCSHSGLNLAKAFTNILEDFGISEKVSIVLLSGNYNHTSLPDPQHYVQQCVQQQHNDP
jgi:hypothetical protein